MSGDRDSDLICAVSTPPGTGGVSMIRLSGAGAFRLVRELCRFLPEKPESHRVYHGFLTDPLSATAIDEVVLAVFTEGRSFTGEETVEISCHGSPVVCSEILRLLVEGGARPADRGEFTSRAFMNGRIDLVQAESVLTLIESRSSAAARLALRQLRGDLSRRLEALEDDVIWALAHIEAGIDFSTEGLDVVDQRELTQRLAGVQSELDQLLESFREGRAVVEGVRVALVGRPNVGKSSLLNAFLQEDRAIVTDIPGTTRDVVEGETQRDGRRFIFLDTAGIRESGDRVEQLGIERSRRAVEQADVVLFVIDSAEGFTEADRVIAAGLEAGRTLLLANKEDRLDAAERDRLFETLKDGKFFQGGAPLSREMVCFVSALDKTARTNVLDRLKTRFDADTAETSAVLSNARHFERLSKACAGVRGARRVLNQGDGSEYVAVELKEALLAIQETLGKRYDDQIMDRVFKEFCIGK